MNNSSKTPSAVPRAPRRQVAPMAFSVGNAFAETGWDRYLGIDPGLARTGYALLQRTPDGPWVQEGGVIRSDRQGTLADRILEIVSGIVEVLDEFRPEALAIEKVFHHGQNPKTALLMAHVRGAILYAAAQRSVVVVHYTPAQVKRLLTGSGRAGKEQVQAAIQRELRLEQPPEPHDVADACAMALCHYYSSRLPV